jgi:hypothetical protein
MGVDPKDVQPILRHADFETMMNQYVKSVPQSARKAMENLESLICSQYAANLPGCELKSSHLCHFKEPHAISWGVDELLHFSSQAARGTAEPWSSDVAKLAAAQRKPVRAIRDSGPAFAAIVLDLKNAEELRKIQRQMVQQEAMLQTGARQGDLEVSVGEFLPVVDALPERVIISLHQALLQHGQDDLGVLGIVLVPSAIAGLAKAGLVYRGDGDPFETFLEQAVGQRAVVVAGRLKR